MSMGDNIIMKSVCLSPIIFFNTHHNMHLHDGSMNEKRRVQANIFAGDDSIVDLKPGLNQTYLPEIEIIMRVLVS